MKTFCFDLDGTLCTNTWGDYGSARPFPWAIQRVNALARAGHRIVIFTARGSVTGVDWRDHTERQLREWGVRYNELRLGKPDADVYVDDRTVHVDAWRYGDALTVEGLPALAPPRSTTLVEVGRTFQGEPYRAPDHARRLIVEAAAHGIATALGEDEIAAAVTRAVEPSRGLLEDGDDVVFTLALAGPPHAGYLDTAEGGTRSTLTVGCRLLSQAAAGLTRLRRGAGVTATTFESTDAWALALDPAGALHDLFGGTVVIVHGRTLQLNRDGANVALAQTIELAEDLGLTIDARPPTLDEARRGDELLLVGMPFCVVPVTALDGDAVPAGDVGPALIRAWVEHTGVEPVTW